MEPEEFARILGLVESDGQPNAPNGDNGRAMGRFQIHPDWMWEWANRLHIQPRLSESWDSFHERLVMKFFQFPFHLKLLPVEVAMTFHLGHIVRQPVTTQGGFGLGAWDIDYAQRWKEKSQLNTGSAPLH